MQKGSLYAHIASKQDLLYAIMREGADAFHAALDAIDEHLPPTERIRQALRAHLRVVGGRCSSIASRAAWNASAPSRMIA